MLLQLLQIGGQKRQGERLSNTSYLLPPAGMASIDLIDRQQEKPKNDLWLAGLDVLLYKCQIAAAIIVLGLQVES